MPLRGLGRILGEHLGVSIHPIGWCVYSPTVMRIGVVPLGWTDNVRRRVERGLTDIKKETALSV